MACLAKDPLDINCILVNSNLSYAEQNFYGFHELIHVFSCPSACGQTFSCFDTVKPHQNPYVEWIANEGAAELLVPYKVLLPIVKENYSDLITDLGVYEFCDKYANLFSVTPTVVQHRIESLKYEISQYVHGTKIENLKILSKRAQESRGIFIKSLVELENERLSDWFDNFHKPVFTSNNSFAF